jgi:uncharacterized membrane protein
MISLSLGHTFAIDKVVPGSLALLFLFLGNYLGKVRWNWFVGIRLPWTLSSEDNWNKTHRFGGKVFFTGGAVALVSCFLPGIVPMVVAIAILGIAVVSVTVYSFRIYSKGR